MYVSVRERRVTNDENGMGLMYWTKNVKFYTFLYVPAHSNFAPHRIPLSKKKKYGHGYANGPTLEQLGTPPQAPRRCRAAEAQTRRRR